MMDFHLSGYGAYVWPAYAATAGVLLALLLTSLRRVIATEGRLTRLQMARQLMMTTADPLAAENGRGDGG